LTLLTLTLARLSLLVAAWLSLTLLTLALAWFTLLVACALTVALAPGSVTRFALSLALLASRVSRVATVELVVVTALRILTAVVCFIALVLERGFIGLAGFSSEHVDVGQGFVLAQIRTRFTAPCQGHGHDSDHCNPRSRYQHGVLLLWCKVSPAPTRAPKISVSIRRTTWTREEGYTRECFL
jgi:hypothetical protein